MYEVFREHIVLGDLTLKNKDFEMFFDNKSYQSDIVNEWVDETLGRLKRGYINMLSESGVLDTSEKENVTDKTDDTSGFTYKEAQELAEKDFLNAECKV